MRTCIIIQARLKSTRLPAKILLPLPTGRVVLEEVVYRCREAKRAHQVIVAMPDCETSEILTPYVNGAAICYGPEHDLLARYHMAAIAHGADIICRVTSDCPLIPPAMIDAVIERRNVHALNYSCNNMPRSYPIGYDCEVFTMNTLRWHAANTFDKSSREHVTTAMRAQVEGARHVNESCPDGDFSHLRWTLDTVEDYARIVRVFEGARGASNLLDVIRT